MPSTYVTPLGPISINHAAPAAATRPVANRHRLRRLLDVALVALAFGFVATTLITGGGMTPEPVPAVISGSLQP